MPTQASLCSSQGRCLSYRSKKNGRWGLYLLSPTVDTQPTSLLSALCCLAGLALLPAHAESLWECQAQVPALRDQDSHCVLSIEDGNRAVQARMAE